MFFEFIPPDILRYIALTYLSCREIVRYYSTNRTIYSAIYNNSSFWRDLYIRDLSDKPRSESPFIYRDLYLSFNRWIVGKFNDETLLLAVKNGFEKAIDRHLAIEKDDLHLTLIKEADEGDLDKVRELLKFRFKYYYYYRPSLKALSKGYFEIFSLILSSAHPTSTNSE